MFLPSGSSVSISDLAATSKVSELKDAAKKAFGMPGGPGNFLWLVRYMCCSPEKKSECVP